MNKEAFQGQMMNFWQDFSNGLEQHFHVLNAHPPGRPPTLEKWGNDRPDGIGIDFTVCAVRPDGPKLRVWLDQDEGKIKYDYERPQGEPGGTIFFEENEQTSSLTMILNGRPMEPQEAVIYLLKPFSNS
jgi:hypothetical protein